MTELNFCSLSSGSSGNCYYLGNSDSGILIDAGISASLIRKYLNNIGIQIETITGILVTHNHIDHVKGLELLTRKDHIPAYTTRKIRQNILGSVKKMIPDSVRTIPMLESFRLAGLEILAFPVCHDAPETIGFHVCGGDRKITIATDLGHISPVAASYIRNSNFLVIESNYDEQMLSEGSYPRFLKARIRSDNGHLGNHQTSSFIAEIINDDLSNICFAHLSRNNNTPEIVLQTLHRTLAEKGVVPGDHLQIRVLDRSVPTGIIRVI
ncbi:MAG TPA: MBL fold metallo-hydrolase [Bacteroidales bacterium]|nr:MBL fold metallo-hydrolase [Bacteroidales bacterium]HOX75088.1 MBL fold metallo-hydrolase [Bacteroidales bacterium]